MHTIFDYLVCKRVFANSHAARCPALHAGGAAGAGRYDPLHLHAAGLEFLLPNGLVLCGRLAVRLALVVERVGPALMTTLGALDARDWAAAAAAFLALTAWNLAGWLTLFYGVFDLGLRLAAEATGFADRSFCRVRPLNCPWVHTGTLRYR